MKLEQAIDKIDILQTRCRDLQEEVETLRKDRRDLVLEVERLRGALMFLKDSNSLLEEK